MGHSTSLLAPRPAARAGHVESWFIRANHPHARRAVWLKTTRLAEPGQPGRAATWCVFFDDTPGTAGRSGVRAWHEVAPGSDAGASDPSAPGGSGEVRFQEASGSWTGALEGAAGRVSWDLAWERLPGPLGDPLVPYPPVLAHAPVPRSRLVTPLPAARFQGVLNVDGVPFLIHEWWGMNGHNWGVEHPASYAWGQCLFPGEGGEPDALVEGFSGRIRLGRRLSPVLSALVVRAGDRTWRFDHLVDLWRQRARVDPEGLAWDLTMRARDATATLHAVARPDEVAALAYRNPGGAVSTCLNSKLARVSLRLAPARGAPLCWESAHGGALEFLFSGPDPRFPHLVGGDA